MGDFTISSYDQSEGHYTLTCRCGASSRGALDFVTRKISILLSDGFVACQSCMSKYIQNIRDERDKNDLMYTYKDVYREYVKKSKAREIPFSLSLEQCSKLFSSPCEYCGTKPTNCRTRVNGNSVYYQGIDRVDNSKGYEDGNVVPCCKHCNALKLDRTLDEFYDHVEKIYFNKVQRLAPQGAYSQVAGNGLHPTRKVYIAESELNTFLEGEDIV